MLSGILSNMDISFFLLVIACIPLSGHLLLRGLFGRLPGMFPLERLVFSTALGIGSLDFSVIALGKAGVPLSGPVVALAFSAVPVAALLARLGFERLRKGPDTRRPVPGFPTPTATERKLFLLLLALTVFVKVFFLASMGLPTATDLGHHMYWSKVIADTERLPDYSKREIIDAGDEHVTLSEPTSISDFIIGEHVPFAAVAKLSGASFFSAFPVLLLLLVNLLSVVAIFLFATHAATTLPLPERLSPFSVGLATLFFAGPLFALSSPEAKFVSGGVIGNLFGDFLIPLVLLAFLRAISERDSVMLGIGISLSLTLAYTHHLSSLVLLFILAGTAIALAVFFRHAAANTLKRIGAIFLSPYPIVALLFAAAFFTFVAAPTYIETHAVETAVGTPSKDTRTGLSFLQASDSAGTARMAIGLAALLAALAFRPIRRSWAFPFLTGWAGALLVMTLRPGWVLLDIPSNRIGNYLSFPFSILAGFFLASFPAFLRGASGRRDRVFLPGPVFLLAVLVVFSFASENGMRDNQASLPENDGKARETLEVFAATTYLAERSMTEDVLLKDHNYVVADSWMKLFFMRDYAYPLSRGYFKRYEDETNPREQCTLLMISTPNLPQGQACYEDLGVNLVAVNQAYDRTQFEKSHDFSRIYAGSNIHVYERNR